MAPLKLPPLALAALALAGCAVAPPAGPTVLVLPPAGKDLAQFQRDDVTCRGYAQQQIGYGAPQQAANRSAVGSAAVGTAVGAAAGAAVGAAAGAPVGAATGSAGTGAAIGAGTGLLAGSAVGAGNASATAAGLQQRYDVAYVQCMAANGDQPQPYSIAGPYGYGPYGYPYPAYYDGWFGPALGDAQNQSNRLEVRTVDLIVMPAKAGIHDYAGCDKKSHGCRPASA